MLEVGSYQLTVPGPIVFGIGRRVNSGKSATVVDEVHKRVLLILVKELAGGGTPDMRRAGGVSPLRSWEQGQKSKASALRKTGCGGSLRVRCDMTKRNRI